LVNPISKRQNINGFGKFAVSRFGGEYCSLLVKQRLKALYLAYHIIPEPCLCVHIVGHSQSISLSFSRKLGLFLFSSEYIGLRGSSFLCSCLGNVDVDYFFHAFGW